MKRILEEEIEEMRGELEGVRERVEELDRVKLELRTENDYLKEREEELNKIKDVETKFEIAINYYEEKIRSKTFSYLKYATAFSKLVNQTALKNRLMNDIRLKAITFKALQRNGIVGKIIKHKQNTKKGDLIWNTFFSWKTYHRNKKLIKSIDDDRNDKTLEKVFDAWKKFSNESRKEKRITQAVSELYRTKLLNAGMKAFKINHRIYHLDKEIEDEENVGALAHNINWMQGLCFSRWKEYVKCYLVPKREKQDFVQAIYNRKLVKKVMSALYFNVADYQRKYDGAELLRDKI